MKEDHSLGVTVDDWRAEIEKLNEGDPGKTVRELCEELGLKRTAMQNYLQELIKEGRCIRGISKRLGAGGLKVYPVAVYQLVKKESK